MTFSTEFFRYTGKNSGNKLEQEVFHKLHNSNELCHLIIDSLMYYHIYADLFMLSKSTDLDLSAFDMNKHYFELQVFLTEVIRNPDIAIDRDHQVFSSEARLYGQNHKTNHRLSSSSVYNNLFELSISSIDTIRPLLVAGAEKMRDKLNSYAHKQLPGGCYWDPEPEVKEVLCQLKPSNDICESVLGLNDYLTTAIPNLHQISCSNLVEVKRNKTLKWLSDIPQEDQHKVIDIAIKQRKQVLKDSKQREKELAKERRDKMLRDHCKRKAVQKKLNEEKEELLESHLMTSSKELTQAIKQIESEGGSMTKLRTKILSLLRTQLNIRKKILNETVPITFTKGGKQKPLEKIIQEVADFIDSSTAESKYVSFIKSPRSLVGKHVRHKFDDDGEMKWYSGYVTDYCESSKRHEIVYEDDDDTRYSFDLLIDLLNGDLDLL